MVDMDAVPDNMTCDNGTPPPVPPKLANDVMDIGSILHGER